MSVFDLRPSFVAVRGVAWFALCLSLITASGCGGGSTPSPPVVPSFQVAVTPPAAGAGTITSNPPGINCPPTCTASFPQNTQVTLTANAMGSYYFAGWTGGCSGMGRCRLKNSERKKVSARFNRGEILNVKLAGTGTGTVLSNPPGINCPTTCSAVFPPNIQVTLSEDPATNDIFSAWSGACTGYALCSLSLTATNSTAANSVIATFDLSAPSGQVIAYVFTPDAVSGNTPQFALLSDGELQSLNHAVQFSLMAGTAFGLVADVSTSSHSNPTLQSYAVAPNGTLRAHGAPQTFASDKFSSLTGDSTYVYAVSDEGIFGFQDLTTGLAVLPAIQQSPAPPSPCTLAEENANQCFYSAWLTLSSAKAFLVQSTTTGSASSTYQLSVFNRSQGQLTLESPATPWKYSTAVPTPDGRFVYGIDALLTGRIFRLNVGGNNTLVWNVLSASRPVSDGFAQLLISSNGSFLFAIVSDGNESPRVRVFRINPTSGELTEVPGSPFLTGQYYFSSATLDPSGHFLLLVDSSCDSSSGPCLNAGELISMSIDLATGALAVISDVPDGDQPYNVSAAPISQ
ncbi:MAG: hypothetical protein WCF22_00655 [Candidatus Sulfotelmatobacter sp.]